MGLKSRHLKSIDLKSKSKFKSKRTQPICITIQCIFTKIIIIIIIISIDMKLLWLLLNKNSVNDWLK